MTENDKNIIKNFLESCKTLEQISVETGFCQISYYLQEIIGLNYSEIELAIDVLEDYRTLCRTIKQEATNK